MSLLLESEPEGHYCFSQLPLPPTLSYPFTSSVVSFPMCVSRSSTLPICIAAFMVHQPSPVLFPQFSHICSCHPTLSTSISRTAARRLFLPKTQSRKCYALCCGSGCSWQHILAQPAACWVNQPRGLSKSVLCASLLVFSESWAIESLPHLWFPGI